jgi:hypothetical protein
MAGAATTRAADFPPTWSSTAKYAAGDTVQLSGNWYRAIKAITTAGPNPATNYTDWQLLSVQANTTLMIGEGQTFPTLAAAWSYVLNAHVADGVYLHLYISSANGSFNESFTSPFVLDHGSGPRIAILGDNQSNDVLSFDNTDGLLIDQAHSINTISGITIKNTGSGGPMVSGLELDLNASIILVSAVKITGFQVAVHATQGSSVNMESNCVLENFFFYACQAEYSASIVLPVDSGAMVISGSGSGSVNQALVADYGGEIIANNCTVSHCEIAIEPYLGGTVEFTNGSVLDCDTGCLATQSGLANCNNTVFSNNTLDLSASVGGYITAKGATLNDGTSVGGSGDGSYIGT